MKYIIELNEIEAKEFFLKKESYVNFDLPTYYSFDKIIKLLDNELNGKKLNDFHFSNPRYLEDVNYPLLSNKDGKYAWRPFKIINPAMYVSLVHAITEKNNWDKIVKRFSEFRKYNEIECHSLPVVSDSDEKKDKESQIFTWWQMIEQKSIALSLDYKYILQTDITDCYGSIYTHSISWAIHTKPIAKEKKNRNKKSLIGVSIDNHLQDMSCGQTNGIPQGSTLMDFITEIVLGYIDELLASSLKELHITNYKVLRYRDDYRIFTNNPFEGEQIAKKLSEILTDMGLKLNAGKTESSDNIIKSSIKPDKRYWIVNKRTTESKQKWLIQLYLLSELFPNSGTLDTQLKEFLDVLKKSKRKDENIESLVSIVTEIACRNPKVVPTSIAILSLFIKQITNKKEKKQTIKRIYNKFQQIPNSSYLLVWLQRLTMKIDPLIKYDEKICKLKDDESITLWNFDWLDENLRNKILKTTVLNQRMIKLLRAVVTKAEIEDLSVRKAYDYE